MTTYYKALRPNGTDFATGTTRPEIGVWMPRIPGRLIVCERGYHVSDAPGETLTGGSWPCRLFEAEIKEQVTPPRYIQGHKRVTHSYRLTREIEAWRALGPNGQDVVALIEQASKLPPANFGQLADTSIAYAARDAAWNAARAAAWDAARTAAQTAAQPAAQAAARAAARAAAWYAAVHAARDAAEALVVRDLISAEHFDALYGPWASVTGR